MILLRKHEHDIHIECGQKQEKNCNQNIVTEILALSSYFLIFQSIPLFNFNVHAETQLWFRRATSIAYISQHTENERRQVV